MPPNSKDFIIKRGKIFTKGGGTRPKPSKRTEKKRNRKRNRGNNKNNPKNRSKTSVTRKSTSISKEIKPQFTW
jgi:hypothetical protein